MAPASYILVCFQSQSRNSQQPLYPDELNGFGLWNREWRTPLVFSLVTKQPCSTQLRVNENMLDRQRQAQYHYGDNQIHQARYRSKRLLTLE